MLQFAETSINNEKGQRKWSIFARPYKIYSKNLTGMGNLLLGKTFSNGTFVGKSLHFFLLHIKGNPTIKKQKLIESRTRRPLSMSFISWLVITISLFFITSTRLRCYNLLNGLTYTIWTKWFIQPYDHPIWYGPYDKNSTMIWASNKYFEGYSSW